MSRDIRIHVKLDVTEATEATIKRLARERNTTTTGLVMQALGIIQVAHDSAKEGYYHGLTKDREKLDTVLIAPLVGEAVA